MQLRPDSFEGCNGLILLEDFNKLLYIVAEVHISKVFFEAVQLKSGPSFDIKHDFSAFVPTRYGGLKRKEQQKVDEGEVPVNAGFELEVFPIVDLKTLGTSSFFGHAQMVKWSVNRGIKMVHKPAKSKLGQSLLIATLHFRRNSVGFCKRCESRFFRLCSLEGLASHNITCSSITT